MIPPKNPEDVASAHNLTGFHLIVPETQVPLSVNTQIVFVLSNSRRFRYTRGSRFKSNEVGGGISSDSAGSSAHARHMLIFNPISCGTIRHHFTGLSTASPKHLLYVFRTRCLYASSHAVRALIDIWPLGDSIPRSAGQYGLFGTLHSAGCETIRR